MRDWGELENVYVFSPEFIAIDFEDRSFTYRKGQDYYQIIRIEPVTGMEFNSVCKIDNRAEFLDNLLETLREANIRKQLEAAPLDKNVIPEGDIKFEALSPQLSQDYLDALRYTITLPNGSSVAFEEPEEELRGLCTDFYYEWDGFKK